MGNISAARGSLREMMVKQGPPPPGVFLVKSAESHEKKGVEFFTSAKEFVSA